MRRRNKDATRWTGRVAVFAILLSLWGVGVLARLYSLQGPKHQELLQRAEAQFERTIEITPRRGDIYDRDRNPIAVSVRVDSIYAVPTEIRNPKLAARRMGSILKIRSEELAQRLGSTKHFTWVKRKVTVTEAKRVKALQLKGVYTQQEMKRFYPKGDFASHVLGYVGTDGKGLAGLEYKMNRLMEGEPRRVLLGRDGFRNTLHSQERAGRPGGGVILSLDETIQYIAERALEKVVRRYRAAGGTLIVQDPYTGEILALAGRPSFNPNRFLKYPQGHWVDRAVAWAYEPGSTLKIVTMAAGLEEELITPRAVIDCENGSIVLAGRRFRDHKPHELLTATQVLAFSSNVGTIKLASRVGERRFYDYIKRFGFGRPTRIGLPGESRGLLRPPEEWSGISLASLSLGQEIGVTPMQLIAAYSAVANGGLLVRPRIVRGLLSGERTDLVPLVPGRRILSAATVRQLKQMLTAVVVAGTGFRARLDGYSAAGKTGTGQKIDETGRYSRTDYVVSFAGFAPVDRPRVTVLVVVDSPQGKTYGAEVAAPVFKSATEQILAYLNVPHEQPTVSLLYTSSGPGRRPTTPQGNDSRMKSLHSEFDMWAVPLQLLQPILFQKLSFSGVQASPVPKFESSVIVPNFTGLPLREVARRCFELGFQLRVRGSGRLMEQNPAPGTRLKSGKKVWARFSR